MLADTKKILVVEDDQDIREMIILILETAGYTVTGLDDGHQVIPFIRDASPDLVLLDVRLGDVDGRDICKALKQDPDTSDIPVIIVSATHGWQTMHEKNCGANDYVAKPFDIDDLLLHVRRFSA